jgi:hypothetical protein
MGDIFKGVDSITDLLGIALIMAFVLLLVKPVKAALSGGDDPVLTALMDLTAVMRDGAEASAESLKQFSDNNAMFLKITGNMQKLEDDISVIRSDIHDELTRQKGARDKE